jgi:nitrogenase molybdenum-iron protein alpha/beta subunit
MTGAVACLTGFSDLGVVIHGSSGCYYYTEAVVPGSVHCTFLVEEEIIFGTEERLRTVVGELSRLYKTIAVVNTCVPSIMGEDIELFLGDYDAIVVDAPGFIGDLEKGYRVALESIKPRVDPVQTGINVDGLCSTDLFYEGNRQEAERMLRNAGLRIATAFCADRFEAVTHASPFTLTANPDLSSSVGTNCGSLLGIEAMKATFQKLGQHIEEADVDPVFIEIEETEERIAAACDKHLRKHDPPHVVICGQFAYAEMIAEILSTHLEADITFIGSRNQPGSSRFPVEHTTDLQYIREKIVQASPDLIVGSSFERLGSELTPFVCITPPLRGRTRLYHPPIIGNEGALYITESVLNACLQDS